MNRPRRPWCLAVALLLRAPLLGAQATPPPQPSAQVPSPMTESTRAHARLSVGALRGERRSFTGPGGRPVELVIPRAVGTLDIVIHFHGAAWLVLQSVDPLGDQVGAAVNLGAGSGAYARPFADPAAFDSLLAGIVREVAATRGIADPATVRIGRITLSGFSAGYGAVRALLREPRHRDRIDAVLLLDGLHTSYQPEGRVLAEGGLLDTTNLVPFADFARRAARGETRFVVTHSEIFPGSFASTTESADWILASLGLRRTAVLQWGPRGMQQLSEVEVGGFTLLGFAGNSAPDHVDHLHALPELLRRSFGR